MQSDAGPANALTCGHRACQGCGEALAARYVLDAAMRPPGGRLVVGERDRLPRGLLHAVPGDVLAGAVAALAVRQRPRGRHRASPRRCGSQGRDDVRVVAQGGDGGTVDIGFACLSGMFERNDDVLYVCYDNEAYMNTGVQRSGATPPAARTATTPAVGADPGQPLRPGQGPARIAMAHDIPYVATATVADLHDLEAQGRAGDGAARRALPARARARARSAGAPPPATRSGSPGWPPRAGCSPSSRPSTARSSRSRRSAAACPSRTTCGCRSRYAHLFRRSRRDDVIAPHPGQADRNIARLRPPATGGAT